MRAAILSTAMVLLAAGCADHGALTPSEEGKSRITNAVTAADFVVLPGPEARFKQFDFDHPGIPAAEQVDSHWGVFIVDIPALSSLTGNPDGYLNVFTDAGWSVQNMRVNQADLAFYTHPALDYLASYFDLGVSVGTDVEQLAAYVVYSDTAFTWFGDGPRSNFPVETDTCFIGGVQGTGADEDTTTGIGDPAPAGNIVFDPAAKAEDDEETIQPWATNVHCKKNQCMPMSIANSLAHLSRWYDFDLKHQHKEGENGDNSLVGQLDKTIGRKPGKTIGTGQSIKGKFAYLKANGLHRKLVHKHQRVAGITDCLPDIEAGNVTASGITSVDKTKNNRVTWDWLCNEIKNGEDVEVSYCFKKDGKYKGHAVKLVGCGETKKKRWIKYIHDSNQKSNKKIEDLAMVHGWIKITGQGLLKLDGNKLINFALSESLKGQPASKKRYHGDPHD